MYGHSLWVVTGKTHLYLASTLMPKACWTSLTLCRGPLLYLPGTEVVKGEETKALA